MDGILSSLTLQDRIQIVLLVVIVILGWLGFRAGMPALLWGVLAAWLVGCVVDWQRPLQR